MKRSQFLGGSVLLVAVTVTVAAGWTHAKSARDQRRTYLGAAVSQLVKQVPPPPAGPAVIEADRQMFRTTRALRGSPRWNRATQDIEQSVPALLKGFSCAAA